VYNVLEKPCVTGEFERLDKAAFALNALYKSHQTPTSKSNDLFYGIVDSKSQTLLKTKHSG
jgi:hypothetical protein